MSISSEIERINNAKIAIREAIANKGVNIPENTKIDAIPAFIANISGGSGPTECNIELTSPTTLSAGSQCFPIATINTTGLEETTRTFLPGVGEGNFVLSGIAAMSTTDFKVYKLNFDTHQYEDTGVIMTDGSINAYTNKSYGRAFMASDNIFVTISQDSKYAQRSTRYAILVKNMNNEKLFGSTSAYYLYVMVDTERVIVGSTNSTSSKTYYLKFYSNNNIKEVNTNAYISSDYDNALPFVEVKLDGKISVKTSSSKYTYYSYYGDVVDSTATSIGSPSIYQYISLNKYNKILGYIYYNDGGRYEDINKIDKATFIEPEYLRNSYIRFLSDEYYCKLIPNGAYDSSGASTILILYKNNIPIAITANTIGFKYGKYRTIINYDNTNPITEISVNENSPISIHSLMVIPFTGTVIDENHVNIRT